MAELRRVGLLPPEGGGDPAEADVIIALYRYLGRTPSRLLALSLADAVGERRTQNQPGTTDEYPNWRVPLAGPDGTEAVQRLNRFDRETFKFTTSQQALHLLFRQLKRSH
jgi:4-alpha-glucanotransferase